jgi:hypothetical protein
MLKTDAFYKLLNCLDNCPVGAFSLTDATRRGFELLVNQLAQEAENEIRTNVLNLDKDNELIYMQETIEAMTRYTGWLLHNCWPELLDSAAGLWADFNERANEETRNLIKEFNRKISGISEDKEDFYTYSPGLFREFFFGFTDSNHWAFTEEEQEKYLEILFPDENWNKYQLEQSRQYILGRALERIWDFTIKMYQRRSNQIVPERYLHEYYSNARSPEAVEWARRYHVQPAPSPLRAEEKSSAPLLWLGKGTELLDLFATLQEKGFIQLPNDNTVGGPTWEAVCRGICKLFDLSKFRRPDSTGEPWQTMNTYFKSRSFDKGTKEHRYDKINYDDRKFDSIPNPQLDLPDSE